MSRIASKTLAVALAAGLAAATPVAFAAPGDGASVLAQAENVRASIDANKTGSITIDKHSGDPVGDGNPGADTALEGMKFKGAGQRENETSVKVYAGDSPLHNWRSELFTC